jgi:hypothetical protein
MSIVTTQPESLAAAAGELHGVGCTLAARNAAAAIPTAVVIPAAADEVSALTATQFATHARLYQVFKATSSISAGSYATTEAASAAAG